MQVQSLLSETQQGKKWKRMLRNLVELRQKQGRDEHSERKGVGMPPSEEEQRKEMVKSFTWGISSGFPLANYFDLPGSESIFGISQDLPMSVHASLSQHGFFCRGLWIVIITCLLTIRGHFCTCVVREVF